MPLTWITTQTTDQDINSTTSKVHAKITKIGATTNQMQLNSPVTGGVIIFDDAAQITALKQFLIDAGY